MTDWKNRSCGACGAPSICITPFGKPLCADCLERADGRLEAELGTVGESPFAARGEMIRQLGPVGAVMAYERGLLPPDGADGSR